MNSYPESKPLKVLPLGSGGGADAQMMYSKQRQELARRGQVIKGYLARQGGPGGMQLDPVLRFHLGLEEADGKGEK